MTMVRVRVREKLEAIRVRDGTHPWAGRQSIYRVANANTATHPSGVI